MGFPIGLIIGAPFAIGRGTDSDSKSFGEKFITRRPMETTRTESAFIHGKRLTSIICIDTIHSLCRTYHYLSLLAKDIKIYTPLIVLSIALQFDSAFGPLSMGIGNSIPIPLTTTFRAIFLQIEFSR
jgi:hypothetical protein